VFPPLLLAQRMHEGRTIKTSKAMIGLIYAKAQGLARNWLTSIKKDQTHLRAYKNKRPMIQHTKALEGVTHSSKALGATPDGCARTHPPENNAMTPVHNSLKPLRE
jgi:hypothetical protein